MLNILIPTTIERRDQLKECIANIEKYADIPYEIFTDENNDGGWVKAIHRFCNTHTGLTWVIGTDVRIGEKTLSTMVEAYNKTFPNKDGIVQPYDEFHEGKLAVHPLGDTETLKKYIYDGYIHCFSDNEMTERAMSDGKYLYVPEAYVEHLHFINKKAEEDETYKKIYNKENYEKDRTLYLERKKEFQPIKRGIVITTSEHTQPFFIDLIKSIQEVKYPIMVVGNNGYCGKGVDIVNDWNGFELGGILRGSQYFDEFVYLQDTVVIKDIKLFDIVFEHKGQSVEISKDFYSYIGKYVSKDIEKVGIPKVENKKEAVFHEISGFRPAYLRQSNPIKLDSLLPIESGVFEEKHGRNNMVLESDYLIKYKGCWDISMIKD